MNIQTTIMGRKEKVDGALTEGVDKTKLSSNSDIPSNDNEANEKESDHLQTPTKSGTAKKIQAPAVESSINQRPRRKVIHKFIKCTRESPEQVVENIADANDREVTTAVTSEAVKGMHIQMSSSQATKTKSKIQRKCTPEKNVRRSNRQNRSKDSVSIEADESNLQMVEIIDDPSDDTNVTIADIIKTCALGKDSESLSNTSISAPDQNDISSVSVEEVCLNLQNSQNSQNGSDKQFQIELIDCIKAPASTSTEENKNSSFEGVFTKASDDIIEVNEKFDIKPTTEFSSQIRTRRITRLSSMTGYRPPETKFIKAKKSSFTKAETVPQLDDSECQKLENVMNPEALDDVSSEEKVVKTPSLSDKVVNESLNEQSSVDKAHQNTIATDQNVNLVTHVKGEDCDFENDVKEASQDYVVQSDENINNENKQKGFGVNNELRVDVSQDEEAQSDKNINDVKFEDFGINTEFKVDVSQDQEVRTDEIVNEVYNEAVEQKTNTLVTEPSKICKNSEHENQPKVKKSKTDKRLLSEKTHQDLNREESVSGISSSPPETTTTSGFEPHDILETKSTKQNKSDFITFMEEKFRTSDPTKQIQQAIVEESENSVRKHESNCENVKMEKPKIKRESHFEKSLTTKESKSKRASELSKKTEKMIHSTHSKDKHLRSESKNSKSSSALDKRSKDVKDARSTDLKIKHHSLEKDSQSKKAHKTERSEKEAATDQTTSHRTKQTANPAKSEKCRDPSAKIKHSSKVKSKPKDPVLPDTKDDKSNSSKVSLDQASTSRKNPQQTTHANKSIKNTDSILSECYLPKQVKYDESLYSIEALKAAQAAQEEQMKVDAAAAMKVRELLAAKEKEAKAARAAARLAKIEEAKAIEQAEAAEITRLLEEAETEKAAKLKHQQAKAAAKAARAKQIKESSNKTNESPRFETFSLFTLKDDSQDPYMLNTNVVKEEIPDQHFIPENFQNPPTFAQYRSPGQLQDQQDVHVVDLNIKSEDTVVQADEEETNIRRSGRIKSITETKQRATSGFGLVKDKDRFHNMYVGDLSYSSMSDSQYLSDYNSSNSNSMLDLSEIEKDTEMETIIVKKEKTEEELEQDRRDVAEGLALFKQIVDCEFLSERTISKETKKMTCDCFLTKSEIERNELGCGEDCLNRLIFIECGSRCAVGDRCTNRRFQKHQNSECVIFKAGKKGFGMKAVSLIPAGEFIMEYVGEVLNSKQFDDRRFKYSNDNIQHHYFMALRSDCVIDATIKGNISRFINHSCDPNAETQKWTVNGELKIGFFSTRTIHPDEEITFDYQFQRYGKEAQKCYCEAENCRGWIGEEPDSEDEEEEDEDDDDEEAEEEEEESESEKEQIMPGTELFKPETTTDDNLIKSPIVVTANTTRVNEKSITIPQTPTKKIKKPKPDQKLKKFKMKKTEIMDDPDLDHEIADLMDTNLKNQAHTLRFSRLMVRAKMLNARSNLLNILRNGELACRRLFLDYHGLKLLHTWMCDPVTKDIQQEWLFRLDILETLEVLPIPNKNMLQDSKVLITVRKWANTKSIKKEIKVTEQEQSPSDSGSGTPISEASSPQIEDSKSVESVKAETKVNSPQVEDSKSVVSVKTESKANSPQVENSKSADSIKNESNANSPEIGDSKSIDSVNTESKANSPQIENSKSIDSVNTESKANSPEIDDSKNVDYVMTESIQYKQLSDNIVIDSSKEITDRNVELVDQPIKDVIRCEELVNQILSNSSKKIDSPKLVCSSKSKEVIDVYDTSGTSVTEQVPVKGVEECADVELMDKIRYITYKLLESWEQLKEVFRIPKKQRIEEMKEHEQEANRSDRRFSVTGADTTDSSKRYSDSYREKDKERFKKEKRNRPKEDPDSMLLKVQRRRLFEAQMAQVSSIEKRNDEKQMEAIHIAKCKYFQLEPRTTSYRDIPFSVSPLSGQWFSNDGRMIATPPSHAHIKPPQELPTNPDEYDLPPMDLPDQWKLAIDSKGRLYYYHVKIRIPQWEPPIKILPLREEQTQHIADIKLELSDDNEIDVNDESLSNLNNSNDLDSEKEDDSDLESSDAVDSSEEELMQKRQKLLNSCQSYQTDLDISANLAVEISAMATTSEKSAIDESTDQSFNLEHSLIHSMTKKKNRDGLATERLISPRTDEERLQSKIEMQRYKANKEKLRRRRENAKHKQHSSVEPSRKLRKLTDGLPIVSQQEDDPDETDDEDEANVSDLDVSVLSAKFVDELDGIKGEKISISNRNDLQKSRLDLLRSNRKTSKRKRIEPEPVSHNSTEAAKRIKEKFCVEMAGVIVQHLRPYRMHECKSGRITSNDDFKHLARKLTHFVMLKELKHCDNTVNVLEVTDSVKTKSKEFIRKYMAKFGDVYVKPANEPEYKGFCNT